MESEWISTDEAAAILGIGRMPANRLAQVGAVLARKADKPHANGHYPWEFNRASVEARAARMKQTPEEPDYLREWMPIAEAMKTLRMTRHGVKRRMKMGLLDFTHFGPPESQALYVSRRQVEEQVKQRPAYARQTEWQELDADALFIAWFAGFFDGEGCLVIRRRDRAAGPNWQLDLMLPNSGVDAVIEIEQRIGGKSYFRKRQQPHYRDQRIWQAHADEALQILKTIRPHLRVKHLQADLGIEFQEHIRAHPASRWETITREEASWRDEQQKKISLLNRPNVIREP